MLIAEPQRKAKADTDSTDYHGFSGVGADIALLTSQGLPPAIVFARIPQENAPGKGIGFRADSLRRAFLRDPDKDDATRSVGPWLGSRAISADPHPSILDPWNPCPV
jgi:hypothetical protein